MRSAHLNLLCHNAGVASTASTCGALLSASAISEGVFYVVTRAVACPLTTSFARASGAIYNIRPEMGLLSAESVIASRTLASIVALT